MGKPNEENLLEKRYLVAALNPSFAYSNHKEANMFLAEDRLLSLGIFCQSDSKFVLKFVPDASAKVDAVDDYIEYLQ